MRDFLFVVSRNDNIAMDAVRERVRLLKGIAEPTIGCELIDRYY